MYQLFQKLIRDAEDIPLSNVDIQHLLRDKTNIVLYKDLYTTDWLPMLLYKEKTTGFENYCHAVLFYDIGTDEAKIGHWIAVIVDQKNKIIYHWDSYGLDPDEENAILNTGDHQYSNLLNIMVNNGYTLDINKEKIQNDLENVATCGRHSALRINFFHLSNDVYNKMYTEILSKKMNNDDISVLLTIFVHHHRGHYM